MRTKSSRIIASVGIVAAASFLLAFDWLYRGNRGLPRSLVTVSLICLAGYIVYVVALKLACDRVYLRRMRGNLDLPEIRKQVLDDIARFKHRVGIVPFVLLLLFVGSIWGFSGVVCALLLALVIIVRARKLRII
jgi:hypothetical protein